MYTHSTCALFYVEEKAEKRTLALPRFVYMDNDDCGELYTEKVAYSISFGWLILMRQYLHGRTCL